MTVDSSVFLLLIQGVKGGCFDENIGVKCIIVDTPLEVAARDPQIFGPR